MGDDDEIVELFLEESLEHLDGVEEDLLVIEKAGAEIDEALVNKVFRAMHTIKGGSSFFGFDKIKDLTHVAENILDRVRKFEMVPSPDVVQVLLMTVDSLNTMLNDTSSIDDFDIADNYAKLTAALEGGVPEEAQASLEETVAIHNKAGVKIFDVQAYDIQDRFSSEKGGEHLYLLEYDLLNDIERKGKKPYDVITELLQLTHFIESRVAFEVVGGLEDFSNSTVPFYALVSTVLEPEMMYSFLELDEEKVIPLDDEGKIVGVADTSVPEIEITETKAPEPAPVIPEPAVSAPTPAPSLAPQAATPAPVKMAETTPAAVAKKASEKKVEVAKAKKSDGGSLRVNISTLEDLMTLAGELVLTRNQLMQASSEEDVDGMKVASQHVDIVTSQLQETIMQTRMQRISIIFGKFNRIVRDISSQLGKQVELEVEGENVELDKTIIESIGDPLTHIVRNSLDHGLEPPDERRTNGKPETGTLSIKAYHEAGQVVIEIVDDGRGIDPMRVGGIAVEKGVVTEEELGRMSEKEIISLIFKPGFSTAAEVTDISGRGVGMDVVMTNLNNLGGVVDLSSKVGEGTTLKIKLPLTLAIMPSLLVSVSEQTYAIPQVNLVQLARIPVNEIENRFQNIGSSLVFRFQGQLIPLVDPGQFLGIDAGFNADLSKDNYGFEKPVHIIVVASGDLKYGIMVDATLDSPEIVVKPLGGHLKGIGIYAGATILGDGGLAPILDVTGIAQDLDLEKVKDINNSEQVEATKKKTKDTQQLLLVSNSDQEVLAIHLSLVDRIERVALKDLDVVGGNISYRYRGETMPLFPLEEVADVSKRDEADHCSIIVFEAGKTKVGMPVKEILDIVDVEVEFRQMARDQKGIFGSAIIRDKMTLLVDLFGLACAFRPDWEEKVVHKDKETRSEKTILVIDDSMFFLNQISSFVEEAGYSVLKAENGQEALQVLADNSDVVDLVLTDIEMPVMDGWDFVKNVRAKGVYEDLPIIAVTSVAGEDNEKRGLGLGINQYLIKLDREEILEHCKRYLKAG